MSDDAVRHSKSSESASAAFAAEGLSNPPAMVAALVTDYVNRATQHIPTRVMASMTAGSGALSASAQTGVSLVLSSLSTEQREVLKAGGNPFNATDIERLTAKLSATLGGHAPAGRDGALGGNFGGRSGPSSMQYGDMDKGMAQARDIAMAHNMPWVANNRELLKLGPAAVQALADVHLKQESYQRLRDGGLSAKTIVSGARWAKRNGVDYNEFSKSYGENQNGLTGQDKINHQKAAEGVLQSSASGRPAAQQNYNKVMDKLKQDHPELHEPLSREQDIVNKQKKLEVMATKTAAAKQVKADTKDADADALLGSLNAPAAPPAKAQAAANEKKPENPEKKDQMKKESPSKQASVKPPSPKV